MAKAVLRADPGLRVRKDDDQLSSRSGYPVQQQIRPEPEGGLKRTYIKTWD